MITAILILVWMVIGAVILSRAFERAVKGKLMANRLMPPMNVVEWLLAFPVMVAVVVTAFVWVLIDP